MKQFNILDTKDFMAKLLTGSAFDDFLLQKATVVTYRTVEIDGRLKEDFFDRDEVPFHGAFVPYSEEKALLLSLIKGKRTPLMLRFILELKPAVFSRVLELDEEEAAALTRTASLIATVQFSEGRARVTSGVSYRVFTADRETEALWDGALSRLLSLRGVSFE